MNGTAIHGVASWRREHHTPVSPRPLRDLTVIALENIIEVCSKEGVEVNPAEEVLREARLYSAIPRAEDRYWFLYRLAP